MNRWTLPNLGAVYIEIGQTTMTMLDGDRFFEWPIERQESGRLTAGCREALARDLNAVLKAKAWLPKRRAYCGIAARGVSLRRLALPPAPKEEFHRLLELQIESAFPLAPEVLAWGWENIGGQRPAGDPSSSRREVVVVAMKREGLDEYRELLAGRGLAPIFTLAALARSTLRPSAARSCAVLDIGHRTSEWLAIEDGVPAAVRVLPWGGEHLAEAISAALHVSRAEAEGLQVDAESVIAAGGDRGIALANAIRSSLGELARLIPPHPAGSRGRGIYLCGRLAGFQGLPQRLAEAGGGEWSCERLPESGSESGSAALLGLRRGFENATGERPLVIECRKARTTEQPARWAQWKWAAVAALLALASLSFRYAEAFWGAPRLARQLEQIRSLREGLPRIDRELAFFQYLQTNQPAYLDAILMFSTAAPPGTRIESLAMNRKGSLSLKGTLGGSQQVIDFRSKLIDSGFFSNVVVEEQTPDPHQHNVAVRLLAQWNPAKVPGDLQMDALVHSALKKLKQRHGPAGPFFPGMPGGPMPVLTRPMAHPPAHIVVGRPPGIIRIPANAQRPRP